MDISLLFSPLPLSCPHGLGPLSGCARELVGVVQEARDHSYFHTQSVVNKMHPISKMPVDVRLYMGLVSRIGNLAGKKVWLCEASLFT